MMRFKLLAALAAMIATPSLAQAPAAPIEARVDVDTGAPGPVIERAIYGQFAEHLGTGIYDGVWVGENSRIRNRGGFRTDVLDALRRIRVPVVRWPGGCFADEYDWRDGIGPRGRRPTRVNTHWGGVTESNAFGTHEFLDFAEALGADAYVAGNMGSMGPREMGQWVEYMTSPSTSSLAEERRRNGRAEPWRVPYFGVGNESWGCGGNMRPEYSADLHRRYATFVKAPRDPGTIRVATGANASDYNFTDVLMREARTHMEAISLHYYTIPSGNWERKGAATGFTEAEWAATLKAAVRMDDIVTRHSQIMDRHDPERRVGLYVDEWGTWYDQEPGSTPGFLYQQNSLRDAHVAALTLNIFHRHTARVKLAAIAQMVNVLQAMILTDGPRMLLTPTYHVFDLYQPFQGATPYAATVAAPSYVNGDVRLPSIDASAARDTEGRLWLALVNVDPTRPARVTTNLTGTASGRLLTGPAIDTHNTFDAPETIQPVAYEGTVTDGRLSFELPAKSIVVVRVVN